MVKKFRKCFEWVKNWVCEKTEEFLQKNFYTTGIMTNLLFHVIVVTKRKKWQKKCPERKLP